MVTRKRNNCRPLHIDGELWQYRWGKKFVTIYTPENKRYNPSRADVLIAYYGEEEYNRRYVDTLEWRWYAWGPLTSWGSLPSDYGLKTLHCCPEAIKAYIINTFAP